MSKLNYKNIFNKELKADGSSGSADAAPRMTEYGRSMVEMLGVLAVMGVLSVAGIAGYNFAMNRHRANELLNEASKRAVVVAGQVTMGGRTPSLSEFTNPTGYTFDVKGPDGTKAWASGDNQFTITVSGVSEAVCNHMQNMKTALIQKFEPSDCTTTATVKLTYNADLSNKNSISDSTTKKVSDCPVGEIQNSDGTCSNNKCTDNSNCANGTYCQVEFINCILGVGICVELEEGIYSREVKDNNNTIIFPEKKFLISNTDMNWQSAKNWCAAHNKKLINLSTFYIKKQGINNGDHCCDFPDGNFYYDDYDGTDKTSSYVCQKLDGTLMTPSDNYYKNISNYIHSSISIGRSDGLYHWTGDESGECTAFILGPFGGVCDDMTKGTPGDVFPVCEDI